jgi:hypothetical protein
MVALVGNGVMTVVRQAAAARELTAADVRVLVVAIELLDYIDYRPLKPAGVATFMAMKPGRVAASIERLSAQGFLDRDPAAPGHYRLPTSQRRGAPRSA